MVIVLVVLVRNHIGMDRLSHRYILVIVTHFSLPFFLQVTVLMFLHSMDQKMIIIIRSSSVCLKIDNSLSHH